MQVLRYIVFAYFLLLGTFVSSSPIKANDFSMDVFIRDNGSYSLQPRRGLAATVEPVCEAASQCEDCTTGQREKEPLCKETGRVQRFKCKQEGKVNSTVLYCCHDTYIYMIST